MLNQIQLHKEEAHEKLKRTENIASLNNMFVNLLVHKMLYTLLIALSAQIQQGLRHNPLDQLLVSTYEYLLLKNYFMNYYSIIGDKFLEKNKSGYN
jgi:hypothetical protein